MDTKRNTTQHNRDMNLTCANKLDNRPDLEEVAKAFKNAKLVAYVGALGQLLMYIYIYE